MATRKLSTVAALCLAALLGACAAAHQASFALAEPDCVQNLANCEVACRTEPGGSYCDVLTVIQAEEIAARGTLASLPPPARLSLSAQLRALCSSGIGRACAAETKIAVQGTATAAASASAGPVTSAVAPDPQQHAIEILDRAEALRSVADNAIQLDGTPEAAQVRQQLMGCRADKQTCFTSTKDFEARSKTGSVAGLADYLTQPLAGYLFSRSHGSSLPRDLRPILQAEVDVAFSEGLVKRAMVEAQKVADARAAETAAVDAATKECASNWATACKAKCEAGDAPSCEVLGRFLLNARPPKRPDARTALVKACDAGLPTACLNIQKIDADLQAAEAAVQQRWYTVQQIGDEIAQNTYKAGFIMRMSPTAQNTRAAVLLRQVVAATIAEKYCPAKHGFLEISTEARLRELAAAHCTSSPPTGPSDRGDSIPLSQDCRATFATACR